MRFRPRHALHHSASASFPEESRLNNTTVFCFKTLNLKLVVQVKQFFLFISDTDQVYQSFAFNHLLYVDSGGLEVYLRLSEWRQLQLTP